LTVDGKTFRQPITVKLDPRLHFTTAELARQLELGRRIVAGMNATYEGYNDAAQLRKELAERSAALKQSSAEAATAAEALVTKVEGLTDAGGPPAGLGPMNRDLTRLLIGVDQADGPPASALVESWQGMCADTQAALQRWDGVRAEAAKLNEALRKAGAREVSAGRAPGAVDCRPM